MKESTQIAYSFAKGLMAKEFPGNRFFEHAKVHLHCPEGAVQKDGPSAGITMASSLLSLALDAKLDPTVAMTGELTVTGKVLRIGGLREKTVAAKRAGARTIIFPRDNWSDWLELPVVSSAATILLEMYADHFNRTSKKAWKVSPWIGTRMYLTLFSPKSTRTTSTACGKKS
jgi:Lon-like ATP-dependent protease